MLGIIHTCFILWLQMFKKILMNTEHLKKGKKFLFMLHIYRLSNEFNFI